MLVGKILISEPMEAARRTEAMMTAVRTVRWPGIGRGNRPSPLAIAAALLLHAAGFALTLAFVRDAIPPSPQDEHSVMLVFAPSSPAEPPEQPAPVETTAPPPEPLPPEPPPPEQAATPPPELPSPPPAIEQPPVPAEPPPAVPSRVAKPVEPPRRLPPPPPAVNRPMARAKPSVPAQAAEPAQPGREPSAVPRPAQSTAEMPIPAEWQRSLAAWLAAHKVYPELARRRGVEGSVALRFTADRTGRVLNVSLTRSAGSPVLDAAAEKMVGDATLPPFPAGMPQATATLTVTINYTLTN